MSALSVLDLVTELGLGKGIPGCVCVGVLTHIYTQDFTPIFDLSKGTTVTLCVVPHRIVGLDVQVCL